MARILNILQAADATDEESQDNIIDELESSSTCQPGDNSCICEEKQKGCDQCNLCTCYAAGKWACPRRYCKTSCYMLNEDQSRCVECSEVL